MNPPQPAHGSGWIVFFLFKINKIVHRFATHSFLHPFLFEIKMWYHGPQAILRDLL